MTIVQRLRAFGLLTFVLLSQACLDVTQFTEFESPEFETLKYTPHILGPAIKGTVLIEDLAALRDDVLSENLRPEDLGYQRNVQYDTIAPFSVNNILLGDMEISDFLQSVEVDSANLRIEFQNTFPIAVNPGARVVFRRTTATNDPSNIIYAHDVLETVPAFGTYSIEVFLEDIEVDADFFLFLENYSTPGGSNIVFPNTDSEVRFNIDFIDVRAVHLKTGKSASLDRTEEVKIDFDDVSDEQRELAAGSLFIFIDNGLPINMDFQLYFKNANGVVYDSLITGNNALGAATTNSEGQPTSIASNGGWEIPVDKDRIVSIEQAKFIDLKFNVDTEGLPGVSVAANDQSFITVQLVLDVNFNLDIKIKN